MHFVARVSNPCQNAWVGNPCYDVSSVESERDDTDRTLSDNTIGLEE